MELVLLIIIGMPILMVGLLGTYGWVLVFQLIQEKGMLFAMGVMYLVIIADMIIACFCVKKILKIKNKDKVFYKLLVIMGIFIGVYGDIYFFIAEILEEDPNLSAGLFIFITALAIAVGTFGIRKLNILKATDMESENILKERKIAEQKSIQDNYETQLRMLKDKKKELEEEKEFIKRRNKEKEKMKNME